MTDDVHHSLSRIDAALLRIQRAVGSASPAQDRDTMVRTKAELALAELDAVIARVRGTSS